MIKYLMKSVRTWIPSRKSWAKSLVLKAMWSGRSGAMQINCCARPSPTALKQQWQRVSALQREFISSGEIAWVDDLESAAIKLRTFADRVRRASRGYSGLFDAVKINEEELAQLYTYDAAAAGPG